MPRDEGIGKFLAVFFGTLCNLFFVSDILAEDNLNSSLGAHYRDFGTRPGQVDIPTQVFRCHDIVCTTVGLTRNHGNLGHSALGVGVK